MSEQKDNRIRYAGILICDTCQYEFGYSGLTKEVIQVLKKDIHAIRVRCTACNRREPLHPYTMENKPNETNALENKDAKFPDGTPV